MAAVTPVEIFFGHVARLGAAGLFVLMLWLLLDCFLGYVIFRLVLVVTGLLAGAYVGVWLISWRIASPSGLEYFLGCLVSSGLLALCGWYLYRLAFAAGVAAGAAMLIAASGSQTSLAWWIVGAVVGVIAGVAAFVYLRAVFIALSGLLGGFGAVFCAGSIIAGGPDRFMSAAGGPGAGIWLTALLAGVSIAVAIAGMYSQTRLARIVRTTLTPEETSRKRRPGRGPGLAERAGDFRQLRSRR